MLEKFVSASFPKDVLNNHFGFSGGSQNRAVLRTAAKLGSYD